MPKKEKYYRVEDSKVLHKDKDCSYLDRTEKDRIMVSKTDKGDKCDRCGK